MKKNIKSYVITSFIIITLQLFMFNNINFLGFINPWIYILIIIIIPQNIKNNHLIIIAFFIGIILDSLFYTFAINTISLISVSWIRPLIIKKLFSGKNYNKKNFISIRNNGFYAYLKYASIITLIHHSIIVIIDYTFFINFSDIIVKIIMSPLMSIIIITCISLINIFNQHE